VPTILITGAAGRIGTMLRSRLAVPGRVLRLIDVTPLPEPLGPGAASRERRKVPMRPAAPVMRMVGTDQELTAQEPAARGPPQPARLNRVPLGSAACASLPNGVSSG
jgi:nucleoside-diphosphate-sugar epimerase